MHLRTGLGDCVMPKSTYRLDYRWLIPDFSGPDNEPMFPPAPGKDKSRTFNTYDEMYEWREGQIRLGRTFADWRVTCITETVIDWSE